MIKEYKNYFFDEIVSIEEEDKDECWDISLLEKKLLFNEPNFIASDFIVHNSGMAEKYIQRKIGKEEYDVHSLLEPIIGSTYGVVCLGKGSRIYTNNGIKNIENIHQKDFVLTEDGSYQRVLKIFNNGVKETVKVRCTNGEELICTPNHKILTHNGWKKANHLTSDDLIKSFWMAEKKEQNIGNDKDWIIGLYIANGALTQSSLTICCESEIFAIKVKKIVDKAYSMNCTIYQRTRCWYVSLDIFGKKHNESFSQNFVSNPLKKDLKDLNLLDLSSKEKQLPKSYSLSMIAGIFEGDKCIDNNQIKINSYNLALDIYTALQSYRINCNIGKDIDEINFITVHEVKYLPLRIKKHKKVKYQKEIYVPRDYILNVSYSECKKRNIPENIWKNHKSKKNKNIVLKDIADRFIDSYPHDHWSKVLSVKNNGKIRVFDLSIENNHSFISGGLVVHNCFQEQLMKIMNVVGQISLPDCEKIRKAMGKKKVKDFMKFKKVFVTNGQKTLKWSSNKVGDLWDQLYTFSNYGFNLCITPDAIVETKNGFKIAGECLPGDIIKSYNIEKKYMFWDEIIKVHNNGIKKVYEIELDNSYTIECTLDHEFICSDGKKRKPKDIVKNNFKIITKDLKSSKIKNITSSFPKMKKVINLEMKSNFHNFIANGIVVGNSHALSYTVISARCLYLKCHYPVEYYAAVLSHLKTADDRIGEYIRDGKKRGLKFRNVDINKSKKGFSIDENDNSIIFGFDKIKGINKETNSLISLQPFKGFEDFIEKFGYSKKTCESLIKLGAFDKFNNNRQKLLNYWKYRKDFDRKEQGMGLNSFRKMAKEIITAKSCPNDIANQFRNLLPEGKKKLSYDKILKLIERSKFKFLSNKRSDLKKYIENNKKDLFNAPIQLCDFDECEDFPFYKKCEFEFDYYGMYFDHPLDHSQRKYEIIDGEEKPKYRIQTIIKYSKLDCLIENVKAKVAKNNNKFYILTLSDGTGQDNISLLLWGNQYDSWEKCLKPKTMVTIKNMASPTKGFSTWTLKDIGSIKFLKRTDELTDKEEYDLKSENDFNETLDLIKGVTIHV